MRAKMALSQANRTRREGRGGLGLGVGLNYSTPIVAMGYPTGYPI